MFCDFKGFLVLYIAYVVVALVGRYINQRQLAKKAEASEKSGSINKEISNTGERTPLLSTDSESPEPK